ncbi:hypothetical protein GP475_07665 [Corynebacterium poyangense]|uniref:Uncharacterized protein n=1 Tax=Corynebacterium poyangense TaxID=2684405 RepID=A0A7H0SPQ2_9CORY|nr:hypothetical protein [Corynebacterium poyangense]MBZ8178113.1 hypothetical protein [Corynebacterium poyangense]QNQ90527.1 hypothetical protein GP475_07665 [Corynebacterium poyangense]
MPKLTALKTSVCAVALVLPLGLAACGSDKADEAQTASPSSTTTTTKTSASTTVTTSESSSPQSSSESSQEPAKPAPPVDSNQVDSIDPLTGQIGKAQLGTVEPVDGSPASPEDRKAIEDLLYGQYKVNTSREFAEYMLVNACQRVVAENGGDAAFDRGEVPDIPINQMPGFQGSGIRAIDDVRVKGDTASAVVTSASGNGQTHTSTMRFQRENGKWTFCN